MKKKVKAKGKIVLLSRKHDVSLFAQHGGDSVQTFAHYNQKHQCIEATNGKVIIRVPVDVQDNECGNMPSQTIIPMKDLVEATRGKETIAQLTTETDARSGAVIGGKLIDFNSTAPRAERSFVVPFQTYPFTDSVMFAGNQKTSIVFSAKILKQIVTYALKYSKSDNPGIRFDIIDDLEIVRFTIQDGEDSQRAHGSFVPMRKI